MNTELEYAQEVTTSGAGADVCHGKFEAAAAQDAIVRVRGLSMNSASTSLYPKFFYVLCSTGDISVAGTFSSAVTLKRKAILNTIAGNTTYKTCSANPTITLGASAGQKFEKRVEGHSSYDSGWILVPAGKVLVVYTNDSGTLPVALTLTILE